MHTLYIQRFTDRMILVLLLVWMGFGCGEGNQPRVDPEEPDFTTTDASELYFNNVRSPFYHTEQGDAAGLKIFRFRKTETGPSALPLSPVIVFNWRSDMAYLIMEPAETGQVQDSIVFEGRRPDGTLAQRMVWYSGSAASQFSFAARLYNSILDQNNITVHFPETQLQLSMSERDKGMIKTVLRDYFRLVEVL